ncbi:class I histocompatibility antigen, F10 alpha chain-like isoform X2 [Puntigrus tetrazona]|uniref:class I histocompatibility antigen, F10 alpha chain-like isoform X2 n=1 Tax=Puntigrus tetrazona TaxID=1606681 RepID=UPI001C8AD59E|nr:class I histocompatibility antigen, F10 alpha chain-like isoform X2 [Puntigrus tetrazona]
MDKITVLFVLLTLLTCTFLSTSNASHSLSLLSTYVEGETRFPPFSYTTVLDDITVGYYDSERYIARGNATNEDDVIDSGYIKSVSDYMYNSFERRSALFRQHRQNDGRPSNVYQTLVVCELLDLDRPGKMIIRDAAGGYTTDEMCYFNNNFTYTVTVNVTQEMLKPHLEAFKHKYENFYYIVCIDTLKNYLKKRQAEVNRKEKPEIKLIRKAISDSGGSRVSCLATGFYPRHINLTLFRDQQPVADHEITGGDLLPNDDGTYQMRKSLEISAADKHKYTCSVTHLSLDNKLDVSLENNSSRYHIGAGVLMFVCAVCVILAIAMWMRRQGRQMTCDCVPSRFYIQLFTK